MMARDKKQKNYTDGLCKIKTVPLHGRQGRRRIGYKKYTKDSWGGQVILSPPENWPKLQFKILPNINQYI